MAEDCGVAQLAPRQTSYDYSGKQARNPTTAAHARQYSQSPELPLEICKAASIRPVPRTQLHGDAGGTASLPTLLAVAFTPAQPILIVGGLCERKVNDCPFPVQDFRSPGVASALTSWVLLLLYCRLISRQIRECRVFAVSKLRFVFLTPFPRLHFMPGFLLLFLH